MNPLLFLLLMLGGILGLTWGLHSLLEKSEDALGDLLAWPTATRPTLSEEELLP